MCSQVTEMLIFQAAVPYCGPKPLILHPPMPLASKLHYMHSSKISLTTTDSAFQCNVPMSLQHCMEYVQDQVLLIQQQKAYVYAEASMAFTTSLINVQT